MSQKPIEMKPLRQDENDEKEIEKISCAEFCSGIATGIKERSATDWGWSLLRFIGLLTALYFFLFSLDLMGGAFKILGGCSAGGMFDGINNPIAGLMIGVLATVLVQSSSTSTSIVVALVGSGSMDVATAIPIVMGANIGTSVTNTIVSMGHVSREEELRRAFSGATVHDMFNFLSVLILLPIEWATGMLYHLTLAMRPASVADDEKWVGPIKILVGPFVKEFVSVDKNVIKNVALGKYTCAEVYANVASGKAKAGIVKGGLFYAKGATEATDMATGAVILVISIVLLCVCLAALVKILQSMVLGTSEAMLKKATSINGYLAILVGTGITILVQSSSITTSVLTPLVGVGVLPLEKMLPLTLGANIGTTFTSMLASLVSDSPDSVQVALCHLFFNLFGIAIWYPVPIMRNVPLNAARGLGELTTRFRSFPIVYLFFMFGAVPGVFLGLSSMLMAKTPALTVLGIILVVVLVMFLGRFIFWWLRRGGKGKFLEYLDSRQHRSNYFKHAPAQHALVTQRLQALEKALNMEYKGDEYEMVSPVVPHGNKVSPKNSGRMLKDSPV